MIFYFCGKYCKKNKKFFNIEIEKKNNFLHIYIYFSCHHKILYNFLAIIKVVSENTLFSCIIFVSK